MNRIATGRGAILLWPDKVRMGSNISNNTRFSLTLNGDYVAIIEIQLSGNSILRNGETHAVDVRVISATKLPLNAELEVRDPINKIGVFQFEKLDDLSNGK